MTANQIAYQRVKEDQRAHLAAETETHRANLTSEEQKRNELAETQRSNLSQESISKERNDETRRANMASEALKDFANREQQRSNMANESLQAQRNAETERSNRANETIGKSQVSLGFAQLGETKRANVASEALKQNANNIQNFKNVTEYETATKRNQLQEQANKLAGYKAIGDLAIGQQNANANSVNSVMRGLSTLLRGGK